MYSAAQHLLDEMHKLSLASFPLAKPAVEHIGAPENRKPTSGINEQGDDYEAKVHVERSVRVEQRPCHKPGCRRYEAS